MGDGTWESIKTVATWLAVSAAGAVIWYFQVRDSRRLKAMEEERARLKLDEEERKVKDKRDREDQVKKDREERKVSVPIKDLWDEVKKDMAAVKKELADAKSREVALLTENARTGERCQTLEKWQKESQDDLAKTQNELADTRKELGETRRELFETKRELDRTKKDLGVALEQLENCKRELAEMRLSRNSQQERGK